LDDPAYYIQSARSFFTPHPLQISIIWNFQPRFNAVLHPALDYWQPLPAFSIALAFLFFGQNLLAAQLPSLLAGALLPVFTYILGRQIFTAITDLSLIVVSRLSLAAAIYVAINPLLVYQSSSPDSSMLYAGLIVGALLCWNNTQAISRGRAFSFGLLSGLAYLARTPAIFLILAWLVWLVWQRFRPSLSQRYNWQTLLLVGLGLVLPVGLWSLRDLVTFGFISSPAGLQTIFINDYQSLFNYETPVNFNTFLSSGFSTIVEVRWEALTNAWSGVLDPLLFPTALPAVIGLIMLVRRQARLIGLAALYTLCLGLGLPLIFGVASTFGSYYHSVGSSAPYLSIGLVYLGWWLASWVKRRRLLRASLLPMFGLLLLSLTILKFVISFQVAAQGAHDTAATYNQLKLWLDQHQAHTVITNEPSSLNYATAIPAIRLPANEDLATLGRLADFYHADYLVITESSGRYPNLLEKSQGQGSRFALVYREPSNAFEIFSISTTTP
jgi:hypothetical protein